MPQMQLLRALFCDLFFFLCLGHLAFIASSLKQSTLSLEL